jgi:hypothetical protein
MSRSFEVTSPRLVGFENGQIVTEDELAGYNVDTLMEGGHLRDTDEDQSHPERPADGETPADGDTEPETPGDGDETDGETPADGETEPDGADVGAE